VVVNLIEKTPIFLICCLVFFLTVTTFILAAPPNPYLYFDIDPVTGEMKPKPSAGQNSELNISKYLQALDECCFAREQGVLQPDGIEYVLALKIDFSDQPGKRTSAEFNEYLFAETGVSLKTYFRENSYGQMDVQPGPVGGVLPAGNEWIRAQKPMRYYGEGERHVPRYRELIGEACRAVDTTVDFSKYDRDKDGVVDHLFVIHAGNDEASTGMVDDIWSILTPDVNIFVDGVRVDTAIVVAEEPDFEKPHLGIYFHEFFHDFGAPDVYGLNFTDARDHKWGLMGAFGPYQGSEVSGVGDGLSPSHIIGYLKWDFDARPENGRLGWIQPVNITQSGQVSVPAFELPPKTDKLFKIDIPHARDALFTHGDESPLPTTATNREFFLIENRYKASGATFDTYLPESGILIWHIDETRVRPLGSYDAGQQIWLEDPNDPEHFGIRPDDPDFIDINTITEGAAYSADDDQTAFTPGTLPNSSANDGTPTGISITNIGPEGTVMKMLVSFGDTYEPNDTIETAFPIFYGQPYYSFLYDASDTQDYYQIETAGGITVRATLSEIPENQNYRLSLLTATGETLATGEKALDLLGYQILYQPSSQQTLYFSVTSDGGFSSVASYKLLVEQIDPESFTLAQIRAYPNPFRKSAPRMTFAYQLSASQSADTVSLEIFTINGGKVYSETHQDVFAPGKFYWDGSNLHGTSLAPGIYIYRIAATQADSVVREIGKFSIIK
jgi:M6 family metalloprotease-like protein